MRMMEKLGYFLESAVKWVAQTGIACPSCGNRPNELLDRKFLVTQLRRCGSCRLIYRTPTGDASRMANFYQRRYVEGFTTDLPSVGELESLLADGFRNTEKDYTINLDVLTALGARPGMRLLDFGCSWGYGSWQLMQAGFEVTSFEISSRRCAYARERLKIDAYDDVEQIGGDFDIIFSSHVLEHVPAVGATISQLWSKLRDGGKFVAFTPNGSLEYRARHPVPWHFSWGMLHPMMLDEMHYGFAFGAAPCILASSPYPLDRIRDWSATLGRHEQCDITGSELLCVAVKPSAHQLLL